jgi:hypothetical protein
MIYAANRHADRHRGIVIVPGRAQYRGNVARVGVIDEWHVDFCK